jgi:hypothetical protein
VRYVRVGDARHELPPINHFGARKTRRSPHIYSAAEIDRLIEAALWFRNVECDDGHSTLVGQDLELLAVWAGDGLGSAESK